MTARMSQCAEFIQRGEMCRVEAQHVDIRLLRRVILATRGEPASACQSLLGCFVIAHGWIARLCDVPNARAREMSASRLPDRLATAEFIGESGCFLTGGRCWRARPAFIASAARCR